MAVRRKKDSETEQPSAPFWMVTYGDMVTLLLTFFVLLLSFAKLDDIKFEEVASSLRGALGILERYQSILQNRSADISTENMQRRLDIYESMTQLKKMAEELGYEDDIVIEASDEGILIRMGNKVLFDLGKAVLRPEAKPILDIVGQTIRNRAQEVLVAGHTDNIPINSPLYPSNWELSTARAVTVVKYLIQEASVPPQVLAATGYSEFRPLVPNDSPENRQKNRRVEFLVTWK
jgi:chemotaxis protein MotB